MSADEDGQDGVSESDFREMVESIGGELNGIVFPEIAAALQAAPRFRSRLSPAFPFPKKVRVGVTSTHVCVEFVGPEDPDDPQFTIEGQWYPGAPVLDFLGIDLSGTHKGVVVPCPTHVENVRFFLGDSMKMLGNYMYVRRSCEPIRHHDERVLGLHSVE